MAYSIGEQLKQARLQRELTLEQVSQATHIRKHYLEALENDQREALPSQVQGRGFLRLYAGHLNLPVAALLAAWDGKPPSEPPTPPPAATPKENEEPPVNTGISTAPAPVEDLPLEPASSRTIFQEIGQDLRKQRESLGLSRAEVERFTRLRQHYIQALEDGQIEQLPSPVQGRGMLSNYVEFLNMDEERVLLRFAEGLQARRIERIPKPEPGATVSKKRPARQAPFWRRFLTPDLVFGVGVAAIILFFVLWTSARISALRTAQARPTPPGIAEVLLTPKASASAPGGIPDPAATGAGTDVAGASIDAPAENPTTTPVNSPIQEVNPQVVSKTPASGGQANTNNSVVSLTPGVVITTPTLAPMNDDPLQVYIVAHQRAWMRVVADDKLKFLGRTIPGNAYAFSGTRRIELQTGNAAALQVYYNTDPLEALGAMGQAVGLVFSQAGIATPTPAFTATSTATLLATITPLPSATPQATFTITPYVP